MQRNPITRREVAGSHLVPCTTCGDLAQAPLWRQTTLCLRCERMDTELDVYPDTATEAQDDFAGCLDEAGMGPGGAW